MKLWVRETLWMPPFITEKMRIEGADTWPEFDYDASIDEYTRGIYKEWKWLKKPSIHMPRFASRITLEVKEIRVEILQDISEEDSWKEGVVGRGITRYGKEGIDLFHILWNSINEKRGYGWDVNPWVWVVVFEILTPSIK